MTTPNQQGSKPNKELPRDGRATPPPVGSSDREEALRRERDRLAALYAGLPSPVVHYGVEAGEALVRGVNAAFEEVFGLSEEGIVDENLDALITPDGRAQQAEVLTQQAVEEGSVQAEVVRETDDGPRYFRLNSVLLEGGEHPEGYAIYTDITEQKEREQTLRKEQKALRAMYRITAAQELPFEEKIQQLIDLGREYLGLSYGFMTRISEDTQHVVRASGTHPLLQPGEDCPLLKSYCRETVQTDNLAIQDARAEGWAEDPAYETFGLDTYVGAQLLVDGAVYGTLCFADPDPRDHPFTERERTFVELMSNWVRYELEQRRATEQLERQNERLNSFASLVAHDLRNPLNVAKGRLELAEQKKDWEHLAAVGRTLDRMDEIIDDVQALTWSGQDLAPEDLEYCDLMRLAKEGWEHVDTSQATLRRDDAPIVKADEGRLQRLLENLFRNAVEHGGETVTVWVGGLEDGFYVEDDGPGISEERRQDVFEAGCSSTEEGTGLGLNIVQTIAESHDWDLSLMEGREGGARFEVRNVEIDS
jgi:PAS domain S-box-containing protein